VSKKLLNKIIKLTRPTRKQRAKELLHCSIRYCNFRRIHTIS